MKIEGKKVSVNANRKKVYNFLSNFNNYEKLMPEQIVNWTSDEESCSFTVKGMADLSLKFEEKTPNTFIKITPNGKVPFSFTLLLNLE
jgi:carbon monoxide dehydrogenase subunit G